MRGGFVPPFARKAAEASGSPPEASAPSAKTIELLGGDAHLLSLLLPEMSYTHSRPLATVNAAFSENKPACHSEV